MTKNVRTQARPDRQKWTDEDLALLEPLAHRNVLKSELKVLLPHRSPRACKNALRRIRARLGITVEREVIEPNYPPRRENVRTCLSMLHPDDEGIETQEYENFVNMAELGSAALLARMQAAGYGARA